MVAFLNPTNMKNASALDATQVKFELLYSEECLKSDEASEGCFEVQMKMNDEVFEFEGTCKDPKRCTYPEFKAYIDSIWYREPGFNDWHAACNY